MGFLCYIEKDEKIENEKNNDMDKTCIHWDYSSYIWNDSIKM